LHNLAKTRISIVGFQTSEERLRNELKFPDKKKVSACALVHLLRKRKHAIPHTNTANIRAQKCQKSKTKTKVNKNTSTSEEALLRAHVRLVFVTSWSSKSL
jgi:hypothetical protein